MKTKILLIITAILAIIEIAGGFYFFYKTTVETQYFASPDLVSSPQNSAPNSSADKNAQPKIPPKPKEVSLIAVGDIMLSRGVAGKMRAKGMDYPFLEVSDYLKTVFRLLVTTQLG